MKTNVFLWSSILFLTTQLTFSQWTQQGSDIDGEAANDQSGRAVSLNNDGSIVAIGAYQNDSNGNNSGHVRVYELQAGNWMQLGSDINGEAANDQSGRSVSLNSNGTVLAVGAPVNSSNGPGSGHVRVYQFDGVNWNQIGNDINGEAAGDQSGISVSLSSDGSIVAVGAWLNDGSNGPGSGHVKVYELQGGNWIQLGSDIDGEAADDNSGLSASLNSDGSIVAIGGYRNDDNGNDAGHTRIYQFDGLNWHQLGNDIDGEAADDAAGESISLNSDGTIVAIGAYLNDGNGNDSGHVRIYQYNVGLDIWEQLGPDIDGEAADDRSGILVSLNGNGTIVAIGAYQNNGNGNNSGHVRMYQFDGFNWNQFGGDIDGEVSDDNSGWSLSLNSDGSSVAIGARYNDGNGVNSGHVRVYEFPIPNTFLGEGSGTNATGDGNVFLGYRAGYFETGSNLLYIDNSDTDAPLIWGDFENDLLRFNGTCFTRSLLPDIDDTYNLGGNGAAFSNIYFDNSLFINDIEFLHVRNNNIAIGNAALTAVAGGSQNVAIGENALAANTTGSNNTAIGNNANTSGNNLTNTTAIGNGALALASDRVKIGNSSVIRIGGYANWSNFSDGRFKTNVKEDIPGLEFIEKLRPVSYEVDQSRLQVFLGEEKAASQPVRKAIGFIAQEVDKIINESNYVFTGIEKPKNKKDHYGIRYAEFVVPLTKAVQELNTLVETQQQRIETLESLIAESTVKQIPDTVIQVKNMDMTAKGSALYQNVPNPFHQTTTISALIPENIQQAKIVVYNLQGLELESYPLTERGNISIEISGSHFPSGIYLYALIVDGRTIDTKKMILTR